MLDVDKEGVVLLFMMVLNADINWSGIVSSGSCSGGGGGCGGEVVCGFVVVSTLLVAVDGCLEFPNDLLLLIVLRFL